MIKIWGELIADHKEKAFTANKWVRIKFMVGGKKSFYELGRVLVEHEEGKITLSVNGIKIAHIVLDEIRPGTFSKSESMDWLANYAAGGKLQHRAIDKILS